MLLKSAIKEHFYYVTHFNKVVNYEVKQLKWTSSPNLCDIYPYIFEKCIQ